MTSEKQKLVDQKTILSQQPTRLQNDHLDSFSVQDPSRIFKRATTSPDSVLQISDISILQRSVGNRAVEHILAARAEKSQVVQRQIAQQKNISVSLASDKEPGDLGHAWIMIERPDGSKDSYGFWPKDFTVLGSLALGWWSGLVMQPDESHKPDALFTAKTTKKELKKGIRYAISQMDASYHLLLFNCSTFARKMFEEATGEIAPSGGLLFDSPNDLADKIKEKNEAKGLDRLGKPVDNRQT